MSYIKRFTKLSFFQIVLKTYQSFRFSIPYTPPSPVFISLEDIVKRLPNLSYQLYFASDNANLEVLAHVGFFFLPF